MVALKILGSHQNVKVRFHVKIFTYCLQNGEVAQKEDALNKCESTKFCL
jgi:hypothetical protein